MLLEYQQGLADAIAARVPVARVAGDADRQALGLRVYRNNSAHARVSALSDTYPAVQRLVGDDCFVTLALDMAARRPIGSADARVWSAQLPAFIAETPLAETLPYLADVARIEVAWLAAYDAADVMAQPLDPNLLSQDRLRLAPGTTVIRSAFPAFAIWRAQRESGDAGDGPAHCPAHCVVYRSGLSVEVKPLDVTAADLLARLETPIPALDWFAAIADETQLQSLAGTLIAAGAIIIQPGDTE